MLSSCQCFIDEIGIADSRRAVPVIRDAIVPESIDVTLVHPEVVHRIEIVADKGAIPIGARPEHILRKRSHERVLTIAELRIDVLVRKISAGVAIHHIEDHGNPVLVRDVDESLKVEAIAEPLIDAKISDRLEAPVQSGFDVGDRHHFNAVDSEIAQVSETPRRVLQILAEFVKHHFVHDQLFQLRPRPCRLPLRSNDDPEIQA